MYIKLTFFLAFNIFSAGSRYEKAIQVILMCLIEKCLCKLMHGMHNQLDGICKRIACIT